MNAEITTPTATPTFTQRLSATPRGARLARRLAAHQLAAWGHPYDSDANHTAQQLVAELAANAVTHGRVPGPDFRLGLFVLTGTLRVEVTDTRGDRLPVAAAGCGLRIVEGLAREWGVRLGPVPRKTVWAELALL